MTSLSQPVNEPQWPCWRPPCRWWPTRNGTASLDSTPHISVCFLHAGTKYTSWIRQSHDRRRSSYVKPIDSLCSVPGEVEKPQPAQRTCLDSSSNLQRQIMILCHSLMRVTNKRWDGLGVCIHSNGR